MSDRLTGELAGCRYIGEAIRLATFLGRFWSVPGKLGQAFHVDRRALADRADLGLSEKRVRRALEALVAVGFLKRMPERGSGYRMTEDGLRRRPALYRFGAEWWTIFASVVRRAAAVVREAALQIGSHQTPARSPTALISGQISGGPKRTAGLEPPVHMGPVKRSGIPPSVFEPDPKLESALERLKEGFRRGRGGFEDGRADTGPEGEGTPMRHEHK
jgi:hypothetical protein